MAVGACKTAFVAVDCASLPETLVESHLFGHARGAFTGAERASEGLLRAAHQGTLFLDEVGDLPQGIQRAFCGRWSCAASVLWERCARWRAISAWWRPPIRIWRP